MNNDLLKGTAKSFLIAGLLALSPTVGSAVTIMSPSGNFTADGPDINGTSIGSVPFTNMSGVGVTLSGTVSASAGTLDALDTLRFGFSFVEDDDTVSLELEEPFDANPNGNGGSGSGILETIKVAVGETAYLVFRDATPTINQGDLLSTDYQVDVAPVPLPAGAWLLLSGGGMVWLMKRRQRTTAVS